MFCSFLILTLVLRHFSLSLDSQKNQELSNVADALTLLDHCHSHVIIDKALQSALLVLENNNITRRCHDIQKQKNVLEDENETLRKQIQSLQQEAEKLNGKLSETSITLCDVKKSKEQLEDDLSSVFQLHNMRYSERNVEKEGGELDNSTFDEKLQASITTLVENNAKLQKTLEATEQDKENLKAELTSVKVSCEALIGHCVTWLINLQSIIAHAFVPLTSGHGNHRFRIYETIKITYYMYATQFKIFFFFCTE